MIHFFFLKRKRKKETVRQLGHIRPDPLGKIPWQENKQNPPPFFHVSLGFKCSLPLTRNTNTKTRYRFSLSLCLRFLTSPANSKTLFNGDDLSSRAVTSHKIVRTRRLSASQAPFYSPFHSLRSQRSRRHRCRYHSLHCSPRSPPLTFLQQLVRFSVIISVKIDSHNSVSLFFFRFGGFDRYRWAFQKLQERFV